MPRQTIPQNNFNNGEISPKAFGRFDYEKYPNSVKKLENFLINQLGGVQFFPGTRYVAATKDSTVKAHMIPFQYNAQQAYVLEMGSRYMRFFTQNAQVTLQAVDPADTATKLLLHLDSDLSDSSASAHTMTAVGNAGFATTQSKFGAGSLYLDGNGDGLTTPDSADFDFSGGIFTVDFWMRPVLTSGGSNQYVWFQGTDANNYIDFRITNTGDIIFEIVIAGVQTVVLVAFSVLTANVWQHIAVVENGNNYYLFLNGVLQSSTSNAARPANYTGVFAIGRTASFTGNDYAGYIDEFRVSKASARWTSGFTPWSIAYNSVAAWVTSHAYVVGDFVIQSGTVYICAIAHTSGTFATDLAAGDWVAQTIYEIATPYAIADVPNIHYAQNADVMYLYHSSYPTQKLTRISATSFTLTAAPFVWGPFLPTNSTATTITPSADTGTSITLTASTSIFQTGHVGSLWRIKSGVVKITAFTSNTVLVGDVQLNTDGSAGNLATGPGSTLDWAEGAFSAVRGYASTGTFHQQRHFLAATPYQPQNFFGSYLAAYDNFKTDANDDSAAVSNQIVSSQVNSIKWLDSDTDFMDAGTSGGIFPVSSGTQGLSITAKNIKANKDTSLGAFSTPPKRVSSYLYYIHKGINKVFEIVYNILTSRQESKDMTLVAEHILRDGQGAFDLDYQQTPNDRLWLLRNDGQIAILVRNVEQQVTGWSRRIAGTDSTSQGIYESIAIIQQESQDDQVWVMVKRTINGTTKRFVEFFTLENFTYQWEAVLLDASLTYDSPTSMTGATKANPVVITAASHGRSNGDYIRIDKVVGMTNLNTNTYKVANATTNTFELHDTNDVAVDGTAYSSYISGGEVRHMVTNVSGADHLNGETVSIQADGQYVGTSVVSGGALVTPITNRAGVIHVGLPYTGTIQMLKLNGQGRTGTGHTKKKRVYGVDFKLYKSKTFKMGQTSSRLFTVPMPSSAGTDLYTGDINGFSIGGTWDANAEHVIIQDQPLPLFLLAVFMGTEIEEKE